ncbi:MAG: nucleotidyltransferase domain-containing protein [Flavobacteriales bacterium]|jgi:predicted nucleotidyltransferase|nr:nucleotidyltransferase domain-containing protein [Flavobacteriales bacterium]
MLTAEQQRIIREVLAPYAPLSIALFGSRARGDQRPDSDLDLLVDLRTQPDFLDLVGLEQTLSERLGMPVDLVTDRSVDPKLRPFIQRDLVRIDART